MINFKKLIKENLAKPVKEVWTNYSDARKATKAAKKNIDTLAIKEAKKNYVAKTGTEMTPSVLKSELETMSPSKETQEYISDKKSIVKEQRSKFKVK